LFYVIWESEKKTKRGRKVKRKSSRLKKKGCGKRRRGGGLRAEGKVPKKRDQKEEARGKGSPKK